jgi:hypothetical protein
MSNEMDVDEREWLESYLEGAKGRDGLLFEAGRIVPLASEEDIEEVFGEDNIGGGQGSAQDHLMEYLRELPGAGYVRQSLQALARVLSPSSITDEYSVEMAQGIGGPQA